jgi:hypothetical protein
MATDGRLEFTFIDITTMNHQLISHHDGRRQRQPQFRIFLGPEFLIGFGNGLDFQIVLFPQPGDYLPKVVSRLPAWFIHKHPELQHTFLLKSDGGDPHG